jgi:hypothetical protein
MMGREEREREEGMSGGEERIRMKEERIRMTDFIWVGRIFAGGPHKVRLLVFAGAV